MRSYQKTITVGEDDLDELNHVNNVRYVQWIQDISKEHWQVAVSEEVKKDIVGVVMTHHIEYKAAAKLGDEIVIKTYINKSKGAISERIVEMYFEQSDQLLIRSSTKWCLLNKESQRPIRIPKQVIDMFSK